MLNYRHVSICWVVPSALPENHPPHVARSSPTQPHPKPRQLHGPHHRIRAGHPGHPEGDRRWDHLLLHGQHAGPDGGDGRCCTPAARWICLFSFLSNRKLSFCDLRPRCFLPTISILPRRPMWVTCSPKQTLRPSSWPMSCDR